MEKQINELEGCKRELSIELTKDELQPYYDNAYKKARPDIEIKGFRKGKVPMNMIKKLFGAKIEAEAEEEIIGEVFQNVAREDKLQILGQPSLTDIKREDDGLQFKLVYETLPDFEPAEYKGIQIDEPVHAVTEEEIEEEINRILTHNGSFENDSVVRDEQYVVQLKLREIDQETQVPVLGQEPQDVNVYLADQTVLPELKRNLLEAEISHTFTFNPSSSDPNAPDKWYKVTVEEIQKLIPAELTTEFVKKHSGEKFETAEDFKEEIGFRLQEQWDEKSRQHMENDLIDKIIDANSDVPVPEGVVRKVMENMVEDLKKRYENVPSAKDLTVDQMENDLRPIAERNVRWEVVRNRIIDKEGLSLEEHDIDPIVEAEAKRQNTDKNALKQAFLQNENLIMNILAKKVMDFLLDFAITNEIEFEEDIKKREEGQSSEGEIKE